MSDGNFILTITRFNTKIETDTKPLKNKQVHIKRKKLNINSNELLYCFENFDDFCNFSSAISKIDGFSTFAKNVVLYFYNDRYYLLFSNINNEHENIKLLYTLITEFGTYVYNCNLFTKILSEHGKIIIKNNAIKTCIKFFLPQIVK